ncbi:MAG: hypothetical protein ACR2LN_06140 [Candidatus Levyibacteriota bacterium]
MNDFVKKIWGILADISGVVGTFNLVFQYVIPYIRTNFKLKVFSGALIILVIVFAIGVLIRFLFVWRTKIRSEIREQAIKRDIKNYEQKGKEVPLKEKLPNNSLLDRWYTEGEEQAKKWADDARLTSLAFFIDILNEETKPRLQCFFISDWKREAMIFYIGASSSISYDEGIYSTFKGSTVLKFFEIFPNWQEAVLKAYNLLSSKIDQKFKIQITFYGTPPKNELFIIFTYAVGKLAKEENFRLADNVLEYKKTNQKITL